MSVVIKKQKEFMDIVRKVEKVIESNVFKVVLFGLLFITGLVFSLFPSKAPNLLVSISMMFVCLKCFRGLMNVYGLKLKKDEEKRLPSIDQILEDKNSDDFLRWIEENRGH